MIVVRPLEFGDIPSVIGLQRACFPPPFPEESLWQREHLEAHLARFPEGQFVAETEGRIIASASNSRIEEDVWLAHLGWEETLGGFGFATCSPSGTTLYGADISVHPEFRRQGVARLLYSARFELVRQFGLVRYGTACRLPDLSASGVPTIETYVAEVAGGKRQDRTLSPLLRMGLQAIGVIHNYMDDPESGNAAALLEWLPGLPPTTAE